VFVCVCVGVCMCVWVGVCVCVETPRFEVNTAYSENENLDHKTVLYSCQSVNRRTLPVAGTF